jgi:hypothetical protein
MRRFWVCDAVAPTAQCAGLLAYSHTLHVHFDLVEDFARNPQAWFLIWHGDPSPLDTSASRPHRSGATMATSFYGHSHTRAGGALPINSADGAGSHRVLHISICSEHLKQGWQRTGAALAATVLLISNPWWYEAAFFDVHLPPLELFSMLVLTAYSFRSRGRSESIPQPMHGGFTACPY